MKSDTRERELSPAEERHRDVTLRLLPVNASLAGLCMGALVFLQAAAPGTDLRFADEVLALDALLFVCCVYLILLGARISSPVYSRQIFIAVDVVFLTALTTMLVSAIYIVYWVF
jgi:hypothetical protein